MLLKMQTHIADWEKEILIFRKLTDTQEYLKKCVLKKKICEFFTLDSNDDVEMHEMKAWEELLKDWQKKYKKTQMILSWNNRYNFLRILILPNTTPDLEEPQQHYPNATIINGCTARTVKDTIEPWEAKIIVMEKDDRLPT